MSKKRDQSGKSGFCPKIAYFFSSKSKKDYYSSALKPIRLTPYHRKPDPIILEKKKRQVAVVAFFEKQKNNIIDLKSFFDTFYRVQKRHFFEYQKKQGAFENKFSSKEAVFWRKQPILFFSTPPPYGIPLVFRPIFASPAC